MWLRVIIYSVSGHNPELEHITIVNSLISMELRPEDREPDEINGYYFDFITEPTHYPTGAALVIQWAFHDGKITIAPPVHASEWAEHVMARAGKDLSMLPDVVSRLFELIRLSDKFRSKPTD